MKRARLVRAVVLTVGTVLVWTAAWSQVFAQAPSPAAPQAATEKIDVKFDHSDGRPRIYDLDLNHGQRFVVRIDQTCEAAFDYSHEPVARGIANQSQAGLGHKDIPIVYDEQYGGYVFHITKKPDADPGALCDGGAKLASTSFIVSIRQQKWNLSFSGAFTISGLTDPVFSITTVNGMKKIIEEPDKASTRKLGAASFVHLFHDHVQWKQLQPALGFGLGINDDNRTEYMVGGALRFGDRATLNVGRVWGSIARLPNGVTLDTPVTDDNILNNLGTRVVSRWFFALSYSFIDTKDRLTKPFSPNTAQTAPATPASAETQTPPTAEQGTTIAAIQEAAAKADTYSAIPEIVAVLKPAGGGARAVCDPTNTAPAKGAIALTVPVSGATPEQLKSMQSKSSAAVTAIMSAAGATLAAQKKKAVLSISEVTFTSGTCK